MWFDRPEVATSFVTRRASDNDDDDEEDAANDDNFNYDNDGTTLEICLPYLYIHAGAEWLFKPDLQLIRQTGFISSVVRC